MGRGQTNRPTGRQTDRQTSQLLDRNDPVGQFGENVGTKIKFDHIKDMFKNCYLMVYLHTSWVKMGDPNVMYWSLKETIDLPGT